MSNKVASFLNSTWEDCIKTPLQVNMKKVSRVARAYFFLPKNSTKEVKNNRMTELLNVVVKETQAVIDCCKTLGADFIAKVP
ncbi:TPA: hypothetical protein RGI28_000227 [Legionella pneumophila]|nr:hypothetical protein [Legionella pneumophila]HAU1190602.1 hypothetical protein [Legionella pneumophila]HBD7101073.1 hypothetical protein [Legionella pneumophila]HDU7928289.1 hypothetical protein [Legionella pneumophila]HDU7934420.1 hypothetical protein [Legionella pneumophila]HEG4431062.1 hypothetical protein [Legionella pneumophila]